jgi:hypothetical protein
MRNTPQTVTGDYLISCHSIHALLLINGTTGATIWTLGGHHNEFTDLSGGNATNFAYQHDARFWTEDLKHITIFDNHEYSFAQAGCTGNCSRGLALTLDFDAKTVATTREYWHPASLASIALGGMQMLPSSGNAMVCWGANPGFTEHTADGTTVWDVQFAPWSSDLLIFGIGFSYRIFKQDWVGLPTWAPSIAVEGNATTSSKAYVSWNGATEIKTWVVVSVLVTGFLPASWPIFSPSRHCCLFGAGLTCKIQNSTPEALPPLFRFAVPPSSLVSRRRSQSEL